MKFRSLLLALVLGPCALGLPALRAVQAIKDLTLSGTTTDGSAHNNSGAHVFLSGASATFNAGSTLTVAGAFNAASATSFVMPATVTGGGSTFQPLDADLTAIAALTTTSYGRATLSLADAAAGRTYFGVVIGTDVQAFDSDLTSWAAITRASGFDTFAATPTSANLASLVTGETGTGALVFGTSPTLTTPISNTLTAATGQNLTLSGGTTATTGVIFSDATAGGSTKFFYPTNAEMVVQNNVSGLNTLVLQNTNAGGFTGATLRASDGVERGTFGYGNSSTSSPFLNSTYIEAAYFTGSPHSTPPPPFKIVMTGYQNGAYGNYLRMSFDATTGTFQLPSGNGTVEGLRYNPVTNRLSVNNGSPLATLTVGGNVSVSSTIDSAAVGSAFGTGSRGSDATAAVNILDSGTNLLRLVKPSVVKVDFQINGTGSTRRLDLVDTDNSSVVPLSVELSGTGAISAGGMRFGYSSVTSVNSVTAATGQPFTATGGDNGASLALGAGASGALTAVSGKSGDTFTIRNTASGGYSTLEIQNSASTQIGTIGSGNASAGTLANALFINAGAAAPFYFARNGNVRGGINTSDYWLIGSNSGSFTADNGAPSATQGEHFIRLNGPGKNVTSRQNTSSSGYSADRFIDDSGNEVGAVGAGNSASGAPFAGVFYNETFVQSGASAWRDFIVAQTKQGSAQTPVFRLSASGVTLATGTASVLYTKEATLTDAALRSEGGVSSAKAIVGNTYFEGTEQASSPAAPAANGFRLYAKDNGAGKTVVYIRFATGAEQQIAIEP